MIIVLKSYNNLWRFKCLDTSLFYSNSDVNTSMDCLNVKENQYDCSWLCVSGKRPDAETESVLSSAAERSHRAARLAADPAARVHGRSHREERSEGRADDGAGGRRCAQGSSSAGGQRWGNAPVRQKVLKYSKIKKPIYLFISVFYNKNIFLYM